MIQYLRRHRSLLDNVGNQYVATLFVLHFTVSILFAFRTKYGFNCLIVIANKIFNLLLLLVMSSANLFFYFVVMECQTM